MCFLQSTPVLGAAAPVKPSSGPVASLSDLDKQLDALGSELKTQKSAIKQVRALVPCFF